MMMLSPARKCLKRSQIQVEEDPECDGADLRPIKKLKPTDNSFITSSPNKFILSMRRDTEEVERTEIPARSSISEEEITETATTDCGLFSRVFSLRSSGEDILYHTKEVEELSSSSSSSEVEESEEATSSSESISCAEAELTDDRTDGELSALADWGEDESESEPEVEVFNPYTFIKNLPARPWTCTSGQSKQLLPPRDASDRRVCLVLDLDETLVHCSTEPLQHPDLVFPVIFNEVTYTVFARKRPYIEKFLLQMSQIFEIVVFTASQEVYADKLLNILDPDRTLIKHRLFRDSCVFVDNNYLKDLSLLGRDLSQTIIVDNSPQAFGYQIDNGIPIESWFDDDLDTELLQLTSFLQQLTHVQDVRPFIRDKYKLHELIYGA